MAGRPTGRRERRPGPASSPSATWASPGQTSGSDAPLATAPHSPPRTTRHHARRGRGLDWATAVPALGAVVAITGVVLSSSTARPGYSSRCAGTGCSPAVWRPSISGTAPRPPHRRPRCPDRGAGRAGSAGHHRRTRHHRHPVRVHTGRHRGDRVAADPSGHAPAVPGAVVSGCSADRGGLRRPSDERPAPGPLDPFPGMARRRDADLFRVRVPALPPAHPGGIPGRDGRRRAGSAPIRPDRTGACGGTGPDWRPCPARAWRRPSAGRSSRTG